MRRVMLLVGAVALVAVLAGVSGGASSASGQARWVITDLGTRVGWDRDLRVPVEMVINERGQIAATAETGRQARGYPIAHAFLWTNGKKIDLGTLGGPESRAVAISDRGQVVGWADTKANTEDGFPITHAFLWENGKMRDLDTLGGMGSGAVAINGRGQILGWSLIGRGTNAPEHAFLWQKGKMRDLGTLGGKTSQAVAVNERGQIVGSAATKATVWNAALGRREEIWHPFLWEKGRMRDLGDLPAALAINDRGQVVLGDAYDSGLAPSTGWRGFLWEQGRVTDLGLLPRRKVLSPSAINNRGKIVGYGAKLIVLDGATAGAIRAKHPFLWEKGKLTDLGALGKTSQDSRAFDINERGQIVGYSTVTSNNPHAFVWEEGKLADLGTLGGRVSQALGINDHNQIVGWATTKTGHKHAVLWSLRSG